MATPPAGWIETGQTLGFSGSVTIQLAAGGIYGQEPLNVFGADEAVFIGIEFDPVSPNIDCGDWDTATTVSLFTRKASESFAARTVESSVAGACPLPYLSVGVTRVVSGLRLAVTVDVDTGTGESRLRYRLWADELTTDTLTVGSKVVAKTYTGEFIQAPAIAVEHQAIPFSGFDPADLPDGVVFAGAEWNGETDPTMFDSYILRGSFPGGGELVWAYATTPPLHYTVDVDVRDAGGAAPAGLVAAGQALVSNPGVEAVTHWRWSELVDNQIAALLSGDWSSGGVSLPVGDDVVPLRQIRPKTPGTAPESWSPSGFTIASPLDVLRSSNVFSGSGAVVVSGTGNLIWTVSGAGASVTRTLLEKWRLWNTFGDPDYHADDVFTSTKADYYGADGQDRWGWGLYAYLDVDLTAPGAGDLTLTVTWVAAGASPVTALKTYTIPVTGAGRVVHRIDLLFPNEGGPWYAERVDEVKFEGFVTGVYQLHDLELVAVQDAYVKLHARGTYSGLVIAQDGTFAIGQWDSNPFIGAGPEKEKDDESGLFSFDGGFESTDAGGCVRMDGTLEDVTDEWERMEGITTTYTAAAIDADLTDGVNLIGTEDELIAQPLTYTARWYHTEMNLRAPANAAQALAASLYLDGGADLCAAPAGTFVLPFRHVLGMVLEAQAKDSVTGLRAGAGAEAFARRSTVGVPTPADPLLASAVTDAGGFVSVAIRDGLVSGSDFYAALLSS